MNFLLGLANPRIDQWAHVGGAVTGAAMAYCFGPRLYLSETPSGGRVIIDRPLLRTPQALEQLPSSVQNKWQQLSYKVLPGLNAADSKPWQRSKISKFRRGAPNRSIKPGPVD